MKRFTHRAALAALLLLPSIAGAQELALPGVPNFHQVTERLYRGAQPEGEAWAGLAKLGVTTVVDLRRPVEHSIAAESIAVCAAGMRYVSYPMNGFATPTHAQIAALLPVLDPAEGKVFVHCKLGCDRTGSVVAAYRIARQGWTNTQALAEANTMGLHWFEKGMRRFIADYRPASVDSTDAPVAKEALAAPAAGKN